MPLTRADVVNVDALKTELSGAFRQFEQRLTAVFGELVYSLDTVVDRYNQLEAKHTDFEAKLDHTQAQLDATQARLDGEIATIKRALNLGPQN